MATMQARRDSQVIAQSDRTVVVEGNHYFPWDDVNADVLTPTRLKSVCYWKGVASYYSVTTSEGTVKNAAWTYRHPSPLARRIKGHVAFWPGDVTVVEV